METETFVYNPLCSCSIYSATNLHSSKPG